MSRRVGTKGQVVIEKEIRDRLGIQPGWLALQLLADDHVKIYFVPPPHNRSLRGVLAPYITKTLPPEDWQRVREQAWEAAAREKMAHLGEEPSAESQS